MSIQGLPYVLLPNEKAVEIANKAASQAGLVPFNEFTGDWIGRMKEQDHVMYYGNKKAKANAMYAFNQPYQVDGEKMHVGVSVHNSVDGSMGFGCGCFTFRQACKNMVLVAGRRNWAFYYSQADHAHTVKAIWKPHRKGLDPFTGHLQNIIAEVMDFARSIVDAYKIMADREVTQELIKKLNRQLPKKALPDWMPTEKEDIAKWDEQLHAATEWEAYNDITEQIWHDPKSGILTKTEQYKRLHRVMPIAR